MVGRLPAEPRRFVSRGMAVRLSKVEQTMAKPWKMTDDSGSRFRDSAYRYVDEAIMRGVMILIGLAVASMFVVAFLSGPSQGGSGSGSGDRDSCFTGARGEEMC